MSIAHGAADTTSKREKSIQDGTMIFLGLIFCGLLILTVSVLMEHFRGEAYITNTSATGTILIVVAAAVGSLTAAFNMSRNMIKLFTWASLPTGVYGLGCVVTGLLQMTPMWKHIG